MLRLPPSRGRRRPRTGPVYRLANQ